MFYDSETLGFHAFSECCLNQKETVKPKIFAPFVPFCGHGLK
jgi:hypothetical protein